MNKKIYLILPAVIATSFTLLSTCLMPTDTKANAQEEMQADKKAAVNQKTTATEAKEVNRKQTVENSYAQEISTTVDNKTTDIYTISGMSKDAIANAVKGTYMHDMADTLYIAEQENGINFRAIYAIGALESGYGRYLSNTCNYFGIKGMGGYRAFKSKQHAILYLAELLNCELYKGKSIEQVARIYCPPDADKWARDVKWIMGEI